MFEFNGENWTVEDIQAAADKQGMSYDEAFERLTQAGMVKEATYDKEKIDSEESSIQQLSNFVVNWWDNVPEKIDQITTSANQLLVQSLIDADMKALSDVFAGEKSDAKKRGKQFIIDPRNGGKVYIDVSNEDSLAKIKELRQFSVENNVELEAMYDNGQTVGDVAIERSEELLKELDTIEKSMMQTGDFMEGVKAMAAGNLKDGVPNVIGGTLGFVGSVAETVIPAMFTKGISIIPQIGLPMYTEYNRTKADALYGENNPNKYKLLAENGESGYVVPATLTGISYALEKIGLKGMTREMLRKHVSSKGARNIALMMNANIGEAATEWGQFGTETLNKSLAEGKDIDQALLEAGSSLFTEDALESAIGGFIGSQSMISGSRGARKARIAFRNESTTAKEIDQMFSMLETLQEASYNAKTREQKEVYQAKIEVVEENLRDYLSEIKSVSEVLTSSQVSELQSLYDKKVENNNKVSKLKKQLDKGLISETEFKDIVQEFIEINSSIDNSINTIKQEAKETVFQKNIKFSKENAGKVNQKYVLVKNVEEGQKLLDKIADSLNEGKKPEDKRSVPKLDETSDGFNLGGFQVTIEDNARKKGRISTGSHELFHGVTRNYFDSLETSQKKKLITSFWNVLTDEQKAYVSESLTIYGAKENDPLSNIDEWIDKGDEMLTAFSDGIALNKISYNEGSFSKILNYIQEILRKAGIKKEFANGRQAYNFLRDYNNSIYKGNLSERSSIFFEQTKDLKPSETLAESRSYTKTPRDIRIDKLGEQYTKEQWDKRGAEEAIGELYMSGDLEAIVKNNLSSALRDLPGFSEEDFVSETIAELIPHVKNFNINRKEDQASFGLSGWIRGQVNNKIGNVLKAKKATREAFESDIEESTQAQVAVAEEQEVELFEEQDLSLVGQAKALKEKTERQSKLRRQLGFETGGEMYNKVLNSAKKSVLLAYRKTQSIKDPAQRAKAIKDLLRKEYFTSGLTSDLFKSTKNFLGTKDYIKNLKEYREAIIEGLSTADLVQMERNVPDSERVFTVFDKKLTKIQEVEDAVNKGLLPTEAINTIGKGTAVNLYRKRMPTEQELVSFANQPAINPVTGQRSGLKGTRKDGFAKAIANSMVLDAVMEVRQSESVVEALQDDAIAQLDLMALSDAVGREVNVKFSKSTATVDINNAIDNNINLAVYSQIKFSRSHREAYENRLTKKRTDLDEKQIKGAVESIFKFVEGDNIPNNKRAKFEKLAFHYMANGYLILPEDGYKVIEAERIATIKKIDPFSYKNPNELIEKFVGEVKGARTNPDTVKEFTNKTDVGQGVTVYDVEDSKKGQLAVRKVIDTHFGKKANPWCLAARQGEYYGSDQAYSEQERDQMIAEQEAAGRSVQVTEYKEDGQTVYELTVTTKPDPNDMLKESFANWKNYNKEGNGYKIAFKNGKLLCFRDGNEKRWWDRNDKPSDKIHFTVTEKKGDVESIYSVVPEDGTKTLTKRTKGKMPNAEVFYVRDDNNYNIKSNTTYVNGAITKQTIETTYKDSRLAGSIYLEKEMGQNADFQLSNITKDIQVLDDNILTTKLKGKVVLTSKQFKQFEDKAVEIEHVTNAQTSETISLTINGVKQNIDVKFSKSAAEVNYNKALNNIKFSRKKQDPYIADQLNIARELGNTSDEIIYARLEQELKNRTPLQEAHAVAFKEAYGDQATEIIQQDGNSIKDLQKNINKFYLPKVRAFAKDVALKKYAKLIKATKDTEAQQDLINNFLINYGRPIRSGKVLNITTNRALLVEMEKAFGEEAMRPYELVPVDSGEKVMVNGEDIDLYKSITPIKSDPAKYTDKVNEQAGFAKKFLFKDVLQDDDLSNGEKKALVQLMFYGQKGPGRKLYKLGAYVEGMPASKTTLEHEITANDMHNAIIDVIDGKKHINELSGIIDNAYVHVLPKDINNIFKKLGKTSSRNLQGYNSMPEVLEYLQTLNLKGNTGLFDFSNNEAISRKGSAIKASRSVNNPTKGITVLDFDDTLATSKSLVKFTRPDGSKGTLTPEQYAATYEDLSDLGYKFDFSEFSKVVDGKPAPLLNKAKKLAGKFGTENMFILTARPADSAPAIKAFLKANGLDIPLKNITGLGNSTAEAKALWMADKVADGYNDFYFADDALKNVQAVKNVLDQFDVKSKIQQARVKFSKSLSPEFNKMIERNKGFAAEQVFDEATAKQLGKDKGKYEFFISAGADDFQGLMMRLAGKGEQGDKDMQFFKETLFDPFNKAYREMNEYAYVMINDLDALIKEYPDVRKRFKQPLEGTDFDTDQAIRIYLWHKNGQDIPGLSDEQAANISSKVASDSRLVEFATKLNKIPKLKGEYVKPGENWTVENIKADIYNAVENSRAEFLLEWQENADELFSEENLNKLEAVYGSNYVDALKNILHRMKTGKNRPAGKDKDTNKLLNWINNSVGAIMFFNSRSAVLQMLSVVNFIDYENNNIFAAGKAFANQKQYWKDFSFLFNSPTLKMRRAGVQTDVSASDIAEAVKGKRNPAKAAIAYLLKIGFTPTQIADSFAISAGGATYYRNQVNFYIKEGMSRLKAEEKAFADFQSKTEEAQQSSRPDRISRQQASVLGRLILAFQNTPMQYNRIIKKAVVDIVNGRGDFKANASRILYYGTAQGLIFNALQNAIFALDFDDDEEKMTDEQLKKAQKFKERKYNRIVDGMISSLLRGSGLTGAYVDSIYKTIKEWQTQREKGWKADHAETIITALNVSPPIGSKFRKLYSAIKSDKFNKDIYDKMSYGNIEHPIYDVASSAIEAATNAPTQRLHRKIINIKDAFQENINAWQRVFLLGGWNKWGLGIEEGVEKEEAREASKKEKKEALKNRKPKKGEVRCGAITSSGKRCKNMTTNKSGLCYAHD